MAAKSARVTAHIMNPIELGSDNHKGYLAIGFVFDKSNDDQTDLVNRLLDGKNRLDTIAINRLEEVGVKVVLKAGTVPIRSVRDRVCSLASAANSGKYNCPFSTTLHHMLETSSNMIAQISLLQFSHFNKDVYTASTEVEAEISEIAFKRLGKMVSNDVTARKPRKKVERIKSDRSYNFLSHWN
jgi:hypothetical protein